jgi:hypothetical protein
MLKCIFIRDLSDADRKVIEDLKRETGCKQASKAIMQAAYSFARVSSVIKRQSERIRLLESENHVLRRNSTIIIEAYKKLDNVLLTNRNDKKTNSDL